VTWRVVPHPRVALDRAEAAAAAGWRTARLPLAGHIRMLKNAHLSCLAVVQMLIMQREVAETAKLAVEAEVAAAMNGCGVKDNVLIVREDDDGVGGVRLSVKKRAKAHGSQAEDEAKEGGEMAGVWGEAIARCPAFRCAPLRKYVRHGLTLVHF